VPALDDTICALSTAPGRAGIAVVRISGPRSLMLARQVFTPRHGDPERDPRRAVLGRVRSSRAGSELDEALVTFFPAPHSYTGEDVVELSLHGSPPIVAAVLEELCALGARLAEPGEFTLRAFAHGRVDLAQAEAVRDVIEAKTLYQAQVAARQRDGALSRELAAVKQLLVDIVVSLESTVEFVDEDLPVEARGAIAEKLDRLGEEVACWVESFRRGRFIRDGFTLAIVGRPNVGKSSLFNALLARDRSIVTDVPGTTRDLVAEATSLDGMPVRLMDTAGIRAAADRVEELGVERSRSAIADADALLHVLDASEAPSPADRELQAHLAGLSSIVVFNKSDLPGAWSDRERADFAAGTPAARVSARTGEGLDLLRNMMKCHVIGGSTGEGLVVTNLRHARALERARDGLVRAGAALRGGLSEEFALTDLHTALGALGEITGETSVDDLLGEIFSRFCVGK
jgi:tRNA modification GTPase